MAQFETLKGNLVKILTEAILSNSSNPATTMSRLARRFKLVARPFERRSSLQEQGLLMKNPRRGMFVITQ
jgi:hypothetical protein